MTVNIPPEGRGAINLIAWCHIENQWRECFVQAASVQSQTAEVIIKGSLKTFVVAFWHIQSVSLKYDDGTIIETFGAPNIINPESIPYATGWQDAFAEAQS